MSVLSHNKINVLMVGTGEYTTGYVNGASSTSDKKVCEKAVQGCKLKAHKANSLEIDWCGGIDYVRPSSSG
jgi:hypothetical protein